MVHDAAVPAKPWQQGVDLEFDELEVCNRSARAFLQLPWYYSALCFARVKRHSSNEDVGVNMGMTMIVNRTVRHHITPSSPLHNISESELEDIEAADLKQAKSP